MAIAPFGLPNRKSGFWACAGLASAARSTTASARRRLMGLTSSLKRRFQISKSSSNVWPRKIKDYRKEFQGFSMIAVLGGRRVLRGLDNACLNTYIQRVTAT